MGFPGFPFSPGPGGRPGVHISEAGEAGPQGGRQPRWQRGRLRRQECRLTDSGGATSPRGSPLRRCRRAARGRAFSGGKRGPPLAEIWGPGGCRPAGCWVSGTATQLSSTHHTRMRAPQNKIKTDGQHVCVCAHTHASTHARTHAHTIPQYPAWQAEAGRPRVRGWHTSRRSASTPRANPCKGVAEGVGGTGEGRAVEGGRVCRKLRGGGLGRLGKAGVRASILFLKAP